MRGDARLQRFDFGNVQTAGIERVAELSSHDRPISEGVIVRSFGDQGRLQHEIGGGLNGSRKIVGRKSVHDQDHGALAWIVEARLDRAVDPIAQLLLHPLGQRVLGLERIVDDDHVGAEASDVAADSGRVAMSAHGGADVVDGAFVEDRSWKNYLVERERMIFRVWAERSCARSSP